MSKLSSFKTGMDSEHFTSRRDAGIDGLSLFEDVDVPDIRTPAPSAPGSETSRLAAAAIDGPFRRKSWRQIMLVLGAASEPLSMHDISERADIPINVVCARIPELEPLWIERHRGACRSHVKASLRVDGFALTAAGRKRLGEAA